MEEMIVLRCCDHLIVAFPFIFVSIVLVQYCTCFWFCCSMLSIFSPAHGTRHKSSLDPVSVKVPLHLFDFGIQFFSGAKSEVDLGLKGKDYQSIANTSLLRALTGVQAATALRIPVERKCNPSWNEAVGRKMRDSDIRRRGYAQLVQAKPSLFSILKSKPWLPYSASTRCDKLTTSNFSGTTPL